ncbi:MAG: hypothetical protein GVY29_13020, partial [Spirochaetes bacterium]|nr:hypothetical protein [Spirochaetota bacterium]
PQGEKPRSATPHSEKPRNAKPQNSGKKPAHAGATKAAASDGPRQAPKPGSETNPEARLRYYREKYGEDFAFTDGERKKNEKKGLFGRIRRALGGEG